MNDILFGNNNGAIIKKLAQRSFHREQQRNLFAIIALALTSFMIATTFSADMELLKANLDRALVPQVPGGEADIRARITELTQQKQGLIARCMEENDISKYELLLTKIIAELEQLNQRLEGIESQRKDHAITESRMAEIDELLVQFAESGLEYDDILTRRLVSAIRVKSAKEIEITYKDGRISTEIINVSKAAPGVSGS